jgi:hypothetical protein
VFTVDTSDTLDTFNAITVMGNRTVTREESKPSKQLSESIKLVKKSDEANLKIVDNETSNAVSLIGIIGNDTINTEISSESSNQATSHNIK